MKTTFLIFAMVFSVSLFTATSVFCQTQTDSLAFWQDQLHQNKIHLKEAKAEYNNAQQYHLGRTEEQKAKDIRKTSEAVQMYQDAIKADKAKIYQLQHTTHKIPAAQG